MKLWGLYLTTALLHCFVSVCTKGAVCTAEGGASPTKEGGSPSKQGGSPSKQGGSPSKQGGALGGLFGSGGDKGSGSQGASGGGGSSWLPTWAGGAKKPEEKVTNQQGKNMFIIVKTHCEHI